MAQFDHLRESKTLELQAAIKQKAFFNTQRKILKDKLKSLMDVSNFEPNNESGDKIKKRTYFIKRQIKRLDKSEFGSEIMRAD